MDFHIGVTDNEWFHFLSGIPDLDEVNFWQPQGARRFRALEPGGLFLFKRHWPDNYIAGGAYFNQFYAFPASLAWEAFGEKNGAPSFEIMRERIDKYLPRGRPRQRDYEIGCIVLTEPFFFERNEWIPAPDDFAKNIVTGKKYSLETETGRAVWEAVRLRLQARAVAEVADVDPGSLPFGDSTGRQDLGNGAAPTHPMFGEPTLIRPRLGQGAFRMAITETYERRCAITGEKALPTLEAAHIRPVSESGGHTVDNGLLLRADVHKLFDRGYVTVTPDYRFLVSRRLKDEFDNGEPYYPFHGSEIWRPSETERQPSRRFLEWHADTVFQG